MHTQYSDFTDSSDFRVGDELSHLAGEGVLKFSGQTGADEVEDP
jgi:hypothetical protein